MPKQSAPSGRVGAPPALKAATQRGRCTAPPNTLKQTDVPPNNRAPPPPQPPPRAAAPPKPAAARRTPPITRRLGGGVPRVPAKHFETNGLATQLSHNPPPATTPQGGGAPQTRVGAPHPPPKSGDQVRGGPGTAQKYCDDETFAADPLPVWLPRSDHVPSCLYLGPRHWRTGPRRSCCQSLFDTSLAVADV